MNLMPSNTAEQESSKLEEEMMRTDGFKQLDFGLLQWLIAALENFQHSQSLRTKNMQRNRDN
jgi:hypothetical protein